MKISEINKFGKDLELYETIDYIGKGFPVFLPKGAIMIKRIQNEVENVLLLNNVYQIMNYTKLKIEYQMKKICYSKLKTIMRTSFI